MRYRKVDTDLCRRFIRKVCHAFLLTMILIVILSKNIDFLLRVRSLVWGVSPNIPDDFQRLPIHSLSSGYQNESTIIVDRTVAVALYHKVKVLCLIPTTQRHVDMGRVRIVNSTWARRCNKVFYITCPSEHHKDFINTCMFQETKETLLNKITYALFHVYKYYLQEFDWILKADDDTYVVMENLRFMLSSHSSNEPGYIGYHFRAHLTHGYHSGGAGFVISRKGLDQMMTQGYERGLCTITGEVEDMEIGKCLQIAGVPVLSSLDKFDRQTFHPEDYVRHITGSYPAWLVRWAREDMAGGTECCSQFVISFHHLDIYSTIVLHQLLYRTSVYGIRTPENIPGMFPVRKIHPLKRFVIP